MSYDTIEASVTSGRPFFLYFFSNGTTITRLTSDAEDYTDTEDEVWTASPIDASDIEVNGNIERQDCNLTFPISDTFARTFLDVANFVTTMTIYRGHHGDPTNELSPHWKGRVVGAFSTGDAIRISAESIFSSMKRIGNRAVVSKQCRHALYHPGCNLDRATFETAGTITAVSGLVLTCPEAASAPADDYKAGIVNWGGIFGMIEVHSGASLTLLNKIPGLADWIAINGPASVLLAPGCNRTRTRCNTRFSNTLNNGSFDKMPTINPFETGIV